MGAGEPFVLGWDTEDDGQGNPFLWAFVHEGGSFSCASRSDALQYLANVSRDQKVQGRLVQAWATNLEYDLCNLFDRERIAEVFLRFGRSYLVGAKWQGVDFRDTVRHVPASVAELGGMVGLKKLEGGMFDGPPSRRTLARYTRRCLRDAAITFRAARHFHEGYAEFDTHPRLTLASTALAIWRDRYWKREIVRPATEVWERALEAYHGGRTQAFAHGEVADVTAIDVASMFPWAMIKAPLPLPWGLYRRVGAGAPLQPLGIYDVDVRSELEFPRLPVRTRDGTLYPNGRFRGWYVGEELLAFVRAGGRADVRGGIEFAETCEPFTRYVRAMFKRKQSARGMNRTLYKLLLNALYGKFGQQGKQVRAVTVERFLAMDPRPESAREWNGLVIYTEEGMPPPWSNNVWPAFVTARARVRLADEIEKIARAGARPLYCDTDSVIFTGNAGRYPERARKIGEFEVRGRYRGVLLVGRKEYALDLGRGRWDAHAKGIPFAERMRYLREGVAEFDRPVRLREAARDSKVPNVWRRFRKERRVEIEPGMLKADGTLHAARIGGRVKRSAKGGV